jgi:hypothetical protein
VGRTFEENAKQYFSYSALKCNAHYDMAERYKDRHRVFGMIVVTVTAVVGTSVFASLGKAATFWIQISTGMLSIAAVVLSALQTFLGFSDLQTHHKTSAAGYGACRRDLEMLLMKFPGAKGLAGEPGTAELETIKKTLDDLDRSSPTIPQGVWDAVGAKVSR